MTAYFAFAFTSFLWIAEVFHTQTPDLVGLLRNNVSGCIVFSRPSFRPGLNSCCQLCLSPIIPGDPIFDLRLVQSKPIRYLLPGSTLLPHSQNFFLQFLNMRVFSFTHTNTPCIVTFSYTGGVLSIVCFYWFGSKTMRLFFHSHYSMYPPFMGDTACWEKIFKIPL